MTPLARRAARSGAHLCGNRSVVAQVVGLIVHNRAVAEAENGQLRQEQAEGVAPGGQGGRCMSRVVLRQPPGGPRWAGRTVIYCETHSQHIRWPQVGRGPTLPMKMNRTLEPVDIGGQMTGQSTGMTVKVIIVALGVLLATVVIAALVATITTRAALSHSEGDQQYSPSETASVDTPRAGICGRTPEVQEGLIDALAIGSCQAINADELYRVRALTVSARTVAPGDFAGMPNLRVLHLGFRTWNPDELSLPAGIFKGLTSLEALYIGTPARGEFDCPLPHQVVADLSKLERLTQDTGYRGILTCPLN